MSYKSKLGIISQSFFVLGFTVAFSAGVVMAQNPYYSAMANSQVAPQGSVAPSQTSTVSVPSVYDQTSPSWGTGYGAQGSVVPAQQAQTFSSVGQYAGDFSSSEVVYQSQPTYGAGFTTMPDYQRNESANIVAPSTPDPAPLYPQSKEEMVPERIGRRPPLTPYEGQETYSYITETATSNSTACQLCNEGYGNPYLWQLGVDAKVKHRSHIEKGDVAFFNYNGTYMVNSNTSFPISAGLGLNATRYLGRNAFNYDIWADISFNGLYDWESEQSIWSMDALYSNWNSDFGGMIGLSTTQYLEEPTVVEGEETPEPSVLTSVLSNVDMKYRATMNSGGLTFKFRKRGRPDPLIGHPNGTWSRECQSGLRYTHLVGIDYTSYNEELDWAGFATVVNSSDVPTGQMDYGYANIDTKNNLLGIVLGGELVDKHCVWSWGMNWKFTPYLNFMENEIGLSNNHGVNQMAKYSETGVAYQAEWGIFSTYKMGKHVIWRIGYDVSCLGNIALAGQNMMEQNSINHSNYNIFQELSIGCTLVW